MKIHFHENKMERTHSENKSVVFNFFQRVKVETINFNDQPHPYISNCTDQKTKQDSLSQAWIP